MSNKRYHIESDGSIKTTEILPGESLTQYVERHLSDALQAKMRDYEDVLLYGIDSPKVSDEMRTLFRPETGR